MVKIIVKIFCIILISDIYDFKSNYLIETYGTRNYTEFDYSNSRQAIYFLFGRETTGLPQEFAQARADHCLRIPQTSHIRSLNLSNAAAIVVYEALRQQGFAGLS
ncbi:tRNA (cytidine(34)-2'-O)-methyltransferase [Snodgrassella alvi]|uniref:tRNA (cytidine(34)-2'-O)-methyltransferase n=1 Tax=Snodgrassella alvi TaxID=1196083 RepID=UPI0021488DA7|nr:TrmH family RNA methyltransferase [Snodgrassella alvi]